MINEELIANKIYIVRGQKVMLDKDLAELYGVTTGNLNKAVKRNLRRFPEDFMFQLTIEEFENLIFQFGISKHGGTRKLPNVFTEEGVAMLSGVLNSDRAIAVNIQIMRLFSKMRRLLNSDQKLLIRIQEIEKHLGEHDDSIDQVMRYLRQFVKDNNEPRKRIGFK